MNETKKTYTIFGGVNGAGKSTFYEGYPMRGKEARVNSDEILRDSGGDWRSFADQSAAMREAIKRLRQYMDGGVSFNQETTLTGNSILRGIRSAKELGYSIRLYYIGLESAELAIARVAHREAHGGHGVREEDIRRRYSGSLENLKKVIPLCDFAEVYDNTEHFAPVCTFENGRLVQGSPQNCSWLKNVLRDSL